LIKHYDSKFHTLNFSNEELNERNSKLIQEIEKLRKSFTDESSELERNVDLLSNEKNNLSKHNNALNQNINKLNSEIAVKEGFINVK
jgi:peptidoglycan hydrolase CwlO-like protein